MSGPRSRLLAAVIVGIMVALVPVLVRVTPAAADQVTLSQTGSEQMFTANPGGGGGATDVGPLPLAVAVPPASADSAVAELALSGVNVGDIAVSTVLALVAGTALLLTARHRRVAGVAITDDQPGGSEILDQLLDERRDE
jgi:hypothetical protein